MTGKLKVERAQTTGRTAWMTVSSGDRGRPISDILERVEARNPEAAKESGFSSAAMRAGAMVRRMRKSRGLSQSELATRIGVTQERISEVERGLGPQGPTFALLDRVAKACGMRIDAVQMEAPAATPAQEDEVPLSLAERLYHTARRIMQKQGAARRELSEFDWGILDNPLALDALCQQVADGIRVGRSPPAGGDKMLHAQYVWLDQQSFLSVELPPVKTKLEETMTILLKPVAVKAPATTLSRLLGAREKS